MTWKKHFNSLYKRLLSAMDNPSEMALDKRITRLATSKGLTTSEALFVVANKYGLQYVRDFAKLTPEGQNRVNQAVNSRSSAPKSFGTKPQKQKRISITLKTPLGQISDPYLPNSISKEAVEMSQTVYPYLYVLENSLRNFITLVLQQKYGADWWTTKINGTKVLSAISSKADDRMKKEIWHSYHSKRGAHPIYYVDFDDLIAICRSFERDFNPLFKNLGSKLNRILDKFEEITPSRNVVAHHNPLSDRDRNRVIGYLHDWLGQLAYIKSQGWL